MKLDVSDALSHPGQEYHFSGSQAIAEQEISGDIVRIDDCAVEGGFMSDEDGNISVRGKLRTIAHAPCANCLEDAAAEIENEFDEVFRRGGDPEDDEIFAYEGHEILLDKLAYIAEYEGRTKNKEIEQLIKKRIADFEELHGLIKTEDDD